MIRYVAAASALKAASLTPLTRRGYRLLGNNVGARRRETRKIPGHYLRRIDQMMELRAAVGYPADGVRMMEIGTGWLHWESVLASLFFDIEAVLFDVWDCRQLGALKNFVGQLTEHIDDVDVAAERRERAHRTIELILAAESLEELYDRLRFTYVVEPDRPIGSLDLETFDLIVSHGVLEHVPRDAVPALVEGIAAMLNPGGISSQAINIQDHLHQYDSTVSRKQYMAYGEYQWKLLFGNSVQYINRLQLSEWRTMFDHPRLELLQENASAVDVGDLDVSDLFGSYSAEDLECGWVHFVHRAFRRQPGP